MKQNDLGPPCEHCGAPTYWMDEEVGYLAGQHNNGCIEAVGAGEGIVLKSKEFLKGGEE